VKLRVPDLSESARTVRFVEPAAALNEMVAASPGYDDQHFVGEMQVEVEVYRFAGDVHVRGSLEAVLHCACSRCLDEYEQPLLRSFEFLLVDPARYPEVEADAGLDSYQGDEIDLGALAREQALLAVDSSIVCSEACKGLCPGCGVNLNREACRCKP